MFLLPKSAKPIVRSTVWSLTPEEKAEKREEIELLLMLIDEKIGNDRTNDEVFAELGDDALPQVETLGDGYEATQLQTDADEYTPEAFDEYLSAQIVTDRGGEMLRGTVKSRKQDSDEKPVGSLNPNPILDTREYLVCFEDDTEDTYTANLIAECFYSQIDENCHQLLLMQKIIDHKKTSDVISEKDSNYSMKSGPKPKQTTRGWRLLVEWKDGTSSWVFLADIKDLYPVQVADYSVVNMLTQEPAFRWWHFKLADHSSQLRDICLAWSGVETRNCDSSYTTPGHDGSTLRRAQRSRLSALRMHTLVFTHRYAYISNQYPNIYVLDTGTNTIHG